MLKVNKTHVVSGFLVGCMFAHAAEGLFKRLSPSEIHLVTNANLATGTSTASFNYAAIHADAISHNEYREPPRTALLRWDDVTFPSRLPIATGALSITLA